MQLLVWEDRFSVGVREFDQHHKILFEMINSLIIAREERKGSDTVKNALEQLHNYTIFHFTAEESMMEYFKFSGLEEHVIEHTKLLNQVEAYWDRLEQHDQLHIEELLEFLANWLLDHTLGLDQKYGPFLQHRVD